MIRYDSITDVVSAYRAGTKVHAFAPAPHDARILLERDKQGRIVGVEILDMHSVVPAMWHQHPDRGELPKDLLDALDSAFLVIGS